MVSAVVGKLKAVLPVMTWGIVPIVPSPSWEGEGIGTINMAQSEKPAKRRCERIAW